MNSIWYITLSRTAKQLRNRQVLCAPIRGRERADPYQAPSLPLPHLPDHLLPSSPPPRKRKREDDPQIPPKRARIPLRKPCNRDTSPEYRPDTVENAKNPLENWVLHQHWPEKYVETGEEEPAELHERDSWLEDYMALPPAPVVQYQFVNGFRLPMPLAKIPSIRRKQSDGGPTDSSDPQKREKRSAPYQDPRYVAQLAAKGSYMEESDSGITSGSVAWCTRILTSKQQIPAEASFRDEVFESVCNKAQNRNEARVIRSITPYIIPSVEQLQSLGSKNLSCLIENIDEAWTNSIPVEGPRPQSDYSVGFRLSAFNDEQQTKLGVLVGSVFDTSYFVATYQMYFPFFTCEVKSGAAALDVADRQNAHSMTLAVRGIVELFRAAGREKELNGQILAFSITHSAADVRIYGHYPAIYGPNIKYYRHRLRRYSFIDIGSVEKWTAYKFTMNIYEVWMPEILRRIKSAIDDLPSGVSFQVVQSFQASQTASTASASWESSIVDDTAHSEAASEPIAAQGIAAMSKPTTPETSVSQMQADQAPLRRSNRKRKVLVD